MSEPRKIVLSKTRITCNKEMLSARFSIESEIQLFSLKTIFEAYETAEFSRQCGSYAVINPDDGRVLVIPSELVADFNEIQELESQISNGHWIELPTRNELDLGKSLVFQFVGLYLAPKDKNRVERYFSRRGGYRKWKALLIERGLEQKWYRFEMDSTVTALKDWLHRNDIAFIDDSDDLFVNNEPLELSH